MENLFTPGSMFFLYGTVRVEVCAARHITGGVAVDVRKPADATDWPWSVTSSIVRMQNSATVEVAAVDELTEALREAMGVSL